MFKLSKRDNGNVDLEQKAIDDIKHIKAALKREPIVQKEFKKYRRNIDDIDDVSIQFDKNLDVSAKTINGNIFLNAEMLQEKWQDYFHYAVHEITHYLQHTSGKCDHNAKSENYLDNPAEIEAFKQQLKYREKTEPKHEVEQYIEDLFDRHDIPEKERGKKKRELLDR